MTRSRTHRTPQRRTDPTLPDGARPSDSGLLGPLEVRAIAEALGIRPTKALGQNFVHDAGTVQRIVRAGGVEAGDEVVEVGPGLGSLTLALLQAGARVRAVEIDPPLARALPETVRARMPEAADRLHVVALDATKIAGPADFGVDWPDPTRLVANLPYNVAVPVLLAMLESFPSITDVLVMVQSEVADRLAAGPGSRTYGVPSVKAAWYGDVERAGTIGRTVFWPVPNVDSALVRLRRTGEPRGGAALRRATFEVCDAAFGQRRKTLRAALKTWAGSPSAAEALLDEAGIDPSARGETLGIDEFVRLGRAVLDLRASGVVARRVDPRAGAPAEDDGAGPDPVGDADASRERPHA
ncbi:16S rRNA (adenine(1518)-N(6)/adenine(1519)-N(6))-dimethyltransferase RsmA [Actinomyces sp. B33]|uniref:16S rRNA (adenine(1518)-N(6)/adenine(1519)-N(6))- dimethyltransferase RsmA n=1 Tax=Actinomyces sp. B33 TaxID=2942131 RepID=UPI0023420D49|nr:16S rRNA (adenine(1518)-N(6)/adenine(1519)-N(6))-dimethyltransferase RsmA [Actinomyces sp. B33]MDC4233757.1 16S rRNA (adenine(1518)-N(6)/adenine(1519)-N(6))-dimethyltransferase RsmA [Actinomyces sp. B33]